MSRIVGIDLGGTNIAVGCVAEDGSEVRGLVSEPTRADLGPDGVVARMVETAKQSMALLMKEKPGAKVVAGPYVAETFPVAVEDAYIVVETK